jgi:hypothetical protein
MLPLPNLESIQERLLELPALFRAYEERDASFADLAREWLNRVEAELEDNRVPAAGAIAGLRGLAISAERGMIPPGVSFVGAPTMRKVRDSTAAEALRRAEETVTNTLRPDLAQLDEAGRLMRQMVAVAAQRGLLRAGGGAGSHSDELHAIWSAFQRDPDIGPGATRALALAGSQNALILLGRELP